MHVNMQLDDQNTSNCESREVSYVSLHDGEHTFEVIVNVSQGVHHASYNWTIGEVTVLFILIIFFYNFNVCLGCVSVL